MHLSALTAPATLASAARVACFISPPGETLYSVGCKPNELDGCKPNELDGCKPNEMG